jgi:DNA-binding transcriptional ArsR family regulator
MNDEKVWHKLQEMDDKLDNIQGDTNVQSQILKEDKKDKLLDLFKRKFGRSTNRRKVWYFASEKRTAESLSEATGLSISQIRNLTSEMTELALLNKAERGDRTVYYRNESTEGIGLEDHVEDYVDDL